MQMSGDDKGSDERSGREDGKSWVVCIVKDVSAQ